MNDCIFCKIAEGAIPCKKIYEDDEMLAFHDVAPQAPVHFLLIPKKHIPSLMDCADGDSALLGRLMTRAHRLAAENGLLERGGRFVINCGQDGNQTVPHLHIHVLGGRPLGWPPG
ncbi:MAG: histidine triad nucleotide-binding protein [Spirochaetaceae bacterium]|jgi:histidine triad (HIT) family protein|nr:histidine triad nucleotide-binding protein [Spirochaetaceae bacterium]